jgi:indolepyruvate ferredoxin oxidoreductase alpha subunit
LIELLSGNEAIARGAYEAGVKVACGYPGTPSTEILENLVHFKDVVYCEWAPNEKVAFEVAAGAAIAGARAIVTMKHVGLNVAADPLMTLAYTGVTGGFVAVVADDPGMHSSQNEQDTRHYARFAKVPMFEPSDSQEAKDFLKLALEVSEQFGIPAILRSSTRISHSRSLVTLEERKEEGRAVGFVKNPQQFVAIPAYARLMRAKLEEKLGGLREAACEAVAVDALAGKRPATPVATAAPTVQAPCAAGGRPPAAHGGNDAMPAEAGTPDIAGIVPNRIEWRDRALGIITSGIVYQYVREVWPEASVLKLGWSFPFPDKLFRRFAAGVKRVLVVEELDDFLEQHAKSLGIACDGKNFVPNIGELSTTRLEASRARMEGRQVHPVEPVPQSKDLPPRPPVLCPGCPHRGVFYALGKYDVVVTGDIGCYSLGTLAPLSRLDTIVCMGAGVSMAHGMVKAGEPRKVVGIIGDSTFFHSGITALLDIGYNKGAAVIIVVDNRTTAMTGHQDHPGTGTTLMGEPTFEARIEDIARACGIKRVHTVNPYEVDKVVKLLGEELNCGEASLIVSRYACPLYEKKPVGKRRIVKEDLCRKCKLCLKLGCPAMEGRDGEPPHINEMLCAGCGLCHQICKFAAVAIAEEPAT